MISAKQSDFLLFDQCFNLIKQKEHLTQAGFEKILALKSNLNKGLTNDLKEYNQTWTNVFNAYSFIDHHYKVMKNFNIRYKCFDFKNDYYLQ